MNIFARQSISKTFLQACTTAVLLVTCLSSQAADSDAEKLFAELGKESIASIQKEIKIDDFLTNSFNDLTVATKNAAPVNQRNADINNDIIPAIAAIGNIEGEKTDAISRQATLIAMELLINTLEQARSNLVTKHGLSL